MKSITFKIAFSFCLLTCASLSAESPVQPGDHVAIVGNTFADQLRIHGYLETLLLQSTQDDPISIRNLGWGGDMLTARDRPTGFPTEESTLTDHQTDVLIACFGFGESFAGEAGLSDFKDDLEDFIESHAGKKYNGESEVRLILVSPIAYEDLGTVTPAQKKRNRELKAYSQAISEVAADANLPFVDLYADSQYFMDEPGPDMTTNGIHLNPYGYWVMSQTFRNQLMDEEQPPAWRITIDAEAVDGAATGIQLSNLESKDGELHFRATELTAPSLSPPTSQSLPPQLATRRDTLTIENLKPGNYTLIIDRETVVTADHNTWAMGVAIDASPAHQEAESYRELVNDKNLQFVYSWKALNQVHIVGERKRSPSGQALPAEVIEFNKLAKERDAALAPGIELKTREWRLVPSSQ